MAQLPNASEAILDLRKLTHYCLSPEHPRGRHKARVFATALGLGRDDATWLRERLLGALPGTDATTTGRDAWGRHFRVDVPITSAHGQAVVRTFWIIRRGATAPRFVTCYVVRDNRGEGP